jgi:hypothetical protein
VFAYIWSYLLCKILIKVSFIDLDVVKLICNLISFENKRTIKEEGLLGSAALLMGGNHDS